MLLEPVHEDTNLQDFPADFLGLHKLLLVEVQFEVAEKWREATVENCIASISRPSEFHLHQTSLSKLSILLSTGRGVYPLEILGTAFSISHW